jgi:cellulose synthase/poly-beta-1,6-N-acetylglucosamine synthase-like glycosyltransferase
VLTWFYILVAQQILQGIYSLWDGLRWLRLVRRRLESHPGFYTPRVALICSCKGLEPGLEENLTAMTCFDYPEYEVFFVLANATDPAREVIERVAKRSEHRAQVVIAGPPKNRGEKVNNLRAAIAQIGEEREVLVFTDSDVRAGRHWLALLVAPLGDPRRGAATTFRWYIPGRGGFWSAFAAAWNAAIVTMFGEHSRNFCWGGGTAIRRKTFDEIRAMEFWNGAVSDDFALTRALKNLARPIYFVPECLAPTLYETTGRGLIEFTNRQIIITRVYSPRLWFGALLSHLSYCGTLGFAAWVILSRMFEDSPWFSLALLALLIPLLAALKGAMRLVAVLEILPDWSAKLLEWNWAWSLLAPLVPFLYFWNTLIAAFSRRIRWRGIRYELVSPNQTRILSHY